MSTVKNQNEKYLYYMLASLVVSAIASLFLVVILLAAGAVTPATVMLSPSACQLAGIHCKIHVRDLRRDDEMAWLTLDDGRSVGIRNDDLLLVEQDADISVWNKVPELMAKAAVCFLVFLGGISAMFYFSMKRILLRRGVVYCFCDMES